MQITKFPLRKIIPYTMGGIVLGLCFPVFASVVYALSMNMSASTESFLYFQRSNILFWIIDTAPIFLGIMATLVGIRTAQLQELIGNLDQTVEERSHEIHLQSSYYQALIQNSPLAIVTLDHQHHIVALNPAFESLFGFQREEVVGKNLDEIITSSEFREEAISLTRRVLDNQPVKTIGKRRCKDGSLVSVEIHGVPVIVNGEHVGALAFYQDISERIRAEQSLKESEARFRSLFDNSPIALMEMDFSAVKRLVDSELRELTNEEIDQYFDDNPEVLESCLKSTRMDAVNHSTVELFQSRDKEEITAAGLIGIVEKKSYRNFRDCLITFLRKGLEYECGMQLRTLRGKSLFAVIRLSIAPGNESTWSRVLISVSDVTERKMIEEKLRYLSLHDPLTGLYNRTFFDAELERLDKSKQRPVSVIIGDMDDLKLINDRYGHASGDLAIKKVAEIMRQAFRQGDVIARIGGDEFAVILPGLDASLARKATFRINQQLSLHNQNANGDAEDPRVHLSVGFATSVQDTEPLSEALKRADEMMYRVKSQRKGGER